MSRYRKLTLLHSNDLHGDFLTEHIDDKLVGGISMLSGYVNQVREQEQNTLYVIAGDMFRGSIIDSEYRGVSTIDLMNLLGPDVVAIGNHEADYGLQHLLFLEKCASFPIINANLYIKLNHRRLFTPCYIAQVDGMKILFIGIITEAILAQTRMDETVGSFVDINEAAVEVGRICNTYNAVDVDLTVLLTHIGHEEDKRLAAQLDPAWGVDVIIGGHSHTLLSEPERVNGIPIVQAGTGTDQIGRFDIVVDTARNTVHEFTWQTIPIDAGHCPRDREVEELLGWYQQKTDAKYNRIVSRFACELTHPDRYQETSLGNLAADILRECYAVDLMMVGSGSIRSKKLGPVVHYSDLTECFPYDDSVYMISVTGRQLEKMLRHVLREEAFQGDHTEFYQLSYGMCLHWSRRGQAFHKLTLDGEPLSEQRLYTVGLQKYHFMNLKEFLDVTLEEVEANRKVRVLATSYLDVVEEYIAAHQHLSRSVEGRIVIL